MSWSYFLYISNAPVRGGIILTIPYIVKNIRPHPKMLDCRTPFPCCPSI
ncbi:hypothetical protein BIFGAL_02986 [Bifidobacterium gallicum DSM 20093 = LMG 11596]|uniref:Uncharacterized protein n=1 Tax=Bifidobacterium gallicum DSM 20093 = LMG 11596 TaxID=561180 RepID=D1NT73_9BIFI|nr:hypothetical protein BIFGAL_02986 [Bifidobacterium gallicum DSM 20093 = LMG 11596]